MFIWGTIDGNFGGIDPFVPWGYAPGNRQRPVRWEFDTLVSIRTGFTDRVSLRITSDNRLPHRRYLYRTSARAQLCTARYCYRAFVSVWQALINGSIALSAKRLYIIYSEGDFEVFRPAGATRCTDGGGSGGEIWRGRVDRAKFHPPHRWNDKSIGPAKLKFLLRSEVSLKVCCIAWSLGAYIKGPMRKFGSSRKTSKCLPILLYGTEASPVNSALRHALPTIHSQ